MSSDREHLRSLIPWYVAGTLSDAERREVDALLEDHPECRAEVEDFRRARRELDAHGAALLEPHPASEELVAAVRGELTGERLDRVRRHVSLCVTCAVEWRWASGAAADDEDRAPGVAVGTPAASGRGWFIAGWLTAAAMAVALFLLPMRGVPDRTGSIRFDVIPAALRAGEPTVVLRAGQEPLYLTFAIDLPASAFPATLTVERDGGPPVFEDAIGSTAELSDGVYWVWCCADATCEPGEYMARVSHRGETPPLTFRFRVADP